MNGELVMSLQGLVKRKKYFYGHPDIYSQYKEIKTVNKDYETGGGGKLKE